MVPMLQDGLDEIIAGDAITSVYQPIVDLDTGRVVAYEALARGPHGTRWESPAALFEAARERGLISELDWACRASAVSGALEAGLGRDVHLFVNAEPGSLGAPVPRRHRALVDLAMSALSIVVEVTERSIVDDPAALVSTLAHVRERGMGVAVDDLGADRGSLALLPFVAPDVIKLDMSLVGRPADAEIAAIASAVRADAERRGAWILAEGIETAQHVDRALALGARLGQGWYFGRPGPLPSGLPLRQRRDDATIRPGREPGTPVTPWSLVADRADRRTTTKRLLMPMSHHVEQRTTPGQPDVVLGAFQDAVHFTDATRRRYERLAEQHIVVGAVGTGMGAHPGRGVRGGTLPDGHPLAGEWAVVVVGPHDAAALIAREVGTADSDGDRPFEYVITHDRDVALAAGRSLMRYLDRAR